MKYIITSAVVILACIALALRSGSSTAAEQPHGDAALFVQYEDAKWQKIVPELGDDSPEIAMLRIDPNTGATELLIRSPKAMHVPTHWHSANETHTVIKGNQAFECGGKREVLTPGGFNYIPAKHQHQAWLSAGSLVFITVDGPWDCNWVAGPPTPKDIGEAAVADVLKETKSTNEK